MGAQCVCVCVCVCVRARVCVCACVHVRWSCKPFSNLQSWAPPSLAPIYSFPLAGSVLPDPHVRAPQHWRYATLWSIKE